MTRCFLKALLFGFVISATAPCFAISLEAAPMRGDRLPLPGAALRVKVFISGSRDIELPVKLLAELDGRSITIDTVGSRDEKDRVVYSADIFAPKVELNYQFLLAESDGTISVSKRLLARRPCVPNVELVPDSELQKMNDSQNAAKLLSLAQRLERDNNLYANAESQLLKLQELLGDGK